MESISDGMNHLTQFHEIRLSRVSVAVVMQEDGLTRRLAGKKNNETDGKLSRLLLLALTLGSCYLPALSKKLFPIRLE